MGVKSRILRLRLDMEDGFVDLDQSINMKMRISKATLAIQNRATIEIFGLTTSLREELLSKFTAWNRRELNMNLASQELVKVTVTAGYLVDGMEQTSTVFTGYVVLCEPISGPPNIGVRITAFSRQVDKLTFTTTDRAPNNTTYLNYVKWAGAQMGFAPDNIICETSYNDVTVGNPGGSILTASALLIDIQDMYKPNVAAFVDNDQLIVKDRDKIIGDDVYGINSFVGIPSWTEWGIEFTTMFQVGVRLASAVSLESRMNPSINGEYVVMHLDYELTSRDRPFYLKAEVNPAALTV